jgi:hypothetical protein
MGCAQRFQGAGERVSEETARKVADALVACQYHLRPAGEKALAVQIDRLSAWARSFNIPHDPAVMPAAYASLAALPPDLIATAFDRAMAGTEDTFRLPLAAKIRAHVADDMAKRHEVLSGLHKMRLAPVERRAPKRTPEEIAAVDAAMAKVRAALAEGALAMRGGDEPHRNSPQPDCGPSDHA